VSTVHPPQMVPLQVLGAQSCVCTAGHAALLPVQLAASVAIAAVQLGARHSVAPSLNPSVGHALLTPSQDSARSHAPAGARQPVPAGCFTSPQTVLMPLQVSATSLGPAAALHVTPAKPAGCWHALLEPLHTSRLHALPSSVHPVPFGFFMSAGHVSATPSHVSSWSHSAAAARQTNDESCFESEQRVDDPVHLSSRSQGPLEALQVVPGLPATCWHNGLVPLHVSVVHTLPSSAQAAPIAFFPSDGHASDTPLQASAMSHSPADARHS
jgi:hypothetical protein